MTAAIPVSQVERKKTRVQPSAVATVQQAEMAAAAPSAVTAVPAPSAVMAVAAVPAAKPKVLVVQATISAAATAPAVKVNAPESRRRRYHPGYPYFDGRLHNLISLQMEPCAMGAGHPRQGQPYSFGSNMAFTDPSLRKSHQVFNRTLQVLGTMYRGLATITS